MSRTIEPEDWENFLKDFSERNVERRARFEVFSRDEVNEESREAHLKKISLEKNDGKTQIVIKRADTSDAEPRTMVDQFENVREIHVQYEVDGSENILEITDEKGIQINLRFESKLDGAS